MDNSAYQDNVREELLNGEIAAMSPRPSPDHYSAGDNIYGIFKRFLKGKTCRVFLER